jgi:hypothetical protein
MVAIKREWAVRSARSKPSPYYNLPDGQDHIDGRRFLYRLAKFIGWNKAMTALTPPPEHADRAAIMGLLKKHGGGTSGPHVETVHIPEARFYEFLAEFLRTRPADPNDIPLPSVETIENVIQRQIILDPLVTPGRFAIVVLAAIKGS